MKPFLFAVVFLAITLQAEANVAVIAAPATAAAASAKAHQKSPETQKEEMVRTHASIVPLSVLMPNGSYLMVEGLDKYLTSIKKHYPKESVRVIDPKTKHRYEIRRLD